MRVLFCGSGWRSFVDVIAARLPAEHEIAAWDLVRPLAEVVADVDVLLPSNAPIDAALLASATRLRLVQQPAAGTDNIDLAAARARGVPVCNAPGASATAVAEMALFLLLALVRRQPAASAAFAAARIGDPIGRELRGRRLGVVGLGRSGTALAAIARAMGMTVSSVTSRSTEAEWTELLATSDAISLHCPLGPATRHLVDDAAFARMKPGALLVNCARGPIVDRAALERALERGQLGGVGLDVFWDEPWDPADPLYRRPDVVVMPHVGGSTEECLGRVADIVAGNIARLIAGEELLHRVA